MGQLAPHAQWLQSPAAAAIGAGLAVVVSRSTGEAAAREGNRKDAILRFRDELYVPMHTEIKSALTRLLAAMKQREPWPQQIRTEAPLYLDPIEQQLGPESVADPTVVGLYRWADFRRDFRIERFTEHARALLDSMLAAAEVYNRSIEALRPCLRDMVTKHLCRALDEAMQTSDFQQWKRRVEELNQASASTGVMAGAAHWYGLLRSSQSTEELAKGWGASWIDSPMTGLRPATVGWILAGCPDVAAQRTYDSHTRSGGVFPPLSWVQDVFANVWEEVGTDSTFREAVEAQKPLLDAVSAAEAHLAMSLRAIQDQFEGGEPPV